MSDTKAKRAVTYIAGAAAIAVAYLCRLPTGEQILSGKAGYLRSFIYIAFFFRVGHLRAPTDHTSADTPLHDGDRGADSLLVCNKIAEIQFYFG